MRGSGALFSSGEDRDHWCTPAPVIVRVLRVGPIALDPCSNPSSIVPAAIRVMRPACGLSIPWPSRAGWTIYVNPPYSNPAQRLFLERCAAYVAAGGLCDVIGCVPARTDTRGFRRGVFQSASRVCFVSGRIVFEGGENGAPFPSAIPYWGHRPEVFARAFEDAGEIWRAA